jgi:hypothetical protein
MTTAPPSCADCLEIWGPQPSVTLVALSRPVKGTALPLLLLLPPPPPPKSPLKIHAVTKISAGFWAQIVLNNFCERLTSFAHTNEVR